MTKQENLQKSYGTKRSFHTYLQFIIQIKYII